MILRLIPGEVTDIGAGAVVSGSGDDDETGVPRFIDAADEHRILADRLFCVCADRNV